MRKTHRVIARLFTILIAAMLPAILVFWVFISGLLADSAATSANRTRAALMNQADRLAFDLDLELTLLDSCFAAAMDAPSLEGGIEAYRSASRWPSLVAAVYWVGTDEASRRISVRRVGSALDDEDRLEPAIRRLYEGATIADGRPGAENGDLTVEGEAVHVIRLPGADSADDGTLIVAVLDRYVLADIVIPTLVESYFGPGSGFGDYAVTLRDPAGARRFSSGDNDSIEAELERPLFRDSMRFDVTGFYAAFFTRGERWPLDYGRLDLIDPPQYQMPPPAPTSGPPSEQFPIDRYRFQSSGERGVWTLSVAGRKRSLEQDAGLQAVGWSVASAAFLALLYGCVIMLYYAVRKSAQLAERERDFVASVTHELKTPVTVILSAGENLAEGIVEQRRVAGYGSIVAKEARRLAETVERLLVMSGLQSTESLARREPVEAADLIEAAIAKLRATASALGVTFSVDIRGEPMIDGSALLLESALEGVIRNAVEYAGGVVRIRAYDKAVGKRTMVVIECSDDGPGVPRPERGRLFEPFFRGSAALAAGTKGTGIGLYLVRRVARIHGGNARLRFPPEGGAVAELTFRSWR